MKKTPTLLFLSFHEYGKYFFFTVQAGLAVSNQIHVGNMAECHLPRFDRFVDNDIEMPLAEPDLRVPREL
jgi:hypothetical protein